MGRVQHGGRTHSSAKNQGKARKTKRGSRMIDQIQQDLLNPARRQALEGEPAFPEDTPGMGAYPCIACDRHFISAEALKGHQRTKVHKRRLKQLQEPGFSVEDERIASGRGVDNRQRELVPDMQVEA